MNEARLLSGVVSSTLEARAIDKLVYRSRQPPDHSRLFAGWLPKMAPRSLEDRAMFDSSNVLAYWRCSPYCCGLTTVMDKLFWGPPGRSERVSRPASSATRPACGLVLPFGDLALLCTHAWAASARNPLPGPWASSTASMSDAAVGRWRRWCCAPESARRVRCTGARLRGRCAVL